MDEDSKLKREEEKEETSLTPKRRDIAIDMAKCAAEKQTEKQTANSKQQGLLGDAPIPASLGNRPGEGNLRVRVNLSSAVSRESPVRAWVLTAGMGASPSNPCCLLFADC